MGRPSRQNSKVKGRREVEGGWVEERGTGGGTDRGTDVCVCGGGIAWWVNGSARLLRLQNV